MGENYYYTVVVEAGGRLLINQQVVKTPDTVTTGAEDVLGWALGKVREQYAVRHAEDPGCELTLMVTDHRPGGLKRRARVTHPDQGLTLASFQGAGEGSSAKVETPPPPRPRAAAPPTVEPPTPVPEETPAEQAAPPQEERQPEVEEAKEPSTVAVAPTADPKPEEAPQEPKQPPQSPKPKKSAPSRNPDASSVPRDESGARGSDWRKIEPDKITRPQVGSAEGDGRSKRAGLIASAKKQKWVQSVGIGVLILLVIVGFRVFNGGETYEAYCVDQRTQTRSVTGVACQDSSDTNHRWWYTADKEKAPDVGDSINSGDGTFDKPSGDKVTINRHVEEDS